MKYITYGKTNKKVSIVGFGGLRFDLSQSNEDLSYLVEHAYDNGINYFDTAPGYCDDRSEDILGIAFRRMIKNQKQDFYVSTKGRPTVFNTADKAIAGVKASIKRLGVDKIDFYHIWCLRNMEHYDIAMAEGGQYEGLLQCKKEGLIDHIVFSSHQSGDEVESVIESGKFEGVTMGLNILNYGYRRKSANVAVQAGLGIVAMNPLSGGTIPDHEEALAFLAEEGETPTEAALKFNLSCSDISVSLIGFSTNEEIDIACDLADKLKNFDERAYENIRLKLGNSMKAICTSCGYCDKCPKGINVPGYMMFYNEKAMFDKGDQEMIDTVYGLEYWNYTQNNKVKSDACTACGICEKECTQHLPIISRLKEIGTWESSAVDNVKV